MKKLICMTCYKGTSSGMCAAGYDDSDTCNSYKKQHVCSGGLAKEKKESCHECIKTCSGCMEKRVELGLVQRDDVAHLL